MRIYEDLRTVQRRVGVVQALVALAVAGLLVYFWHLQVIRGKYFRDLAENNRIRALPIPAPRGPLFDRKGRILAENRSSFNVVVTSERKDSLGGALERLSRLISFDPKEVRERLNTQGPRFRTVVVKADASDEDVATIEARRMEEPEASVDDALRKMREADIRRLPVVRDGRPVGIVSLGDLAVEREPDSTLADISAASPDD